MKAKFQAQKGKRIKRASRNLWGCSNRDIILFSDGTISLGTWEEERLLQGLPILGMCYDKRNNPFTIKAYSLKAAIRKVRKISPFLPHKTIFSDYPGWRRYRMEIFVDNKNYNSEKIKAQIYNREFVLKSEYTNNHPEDNPFSRLVTFLRRKGYFVSVKPEYGWKRTTYKSTYFLPNNEIQYWSANVIGKNLRAAFCTENNGYSYSYLNNKISIDREDYFDKWSKCPYEFKLPESEQDYKDLMKVIENVVDPNGYYKI